MTTAERVVDRLLRDLDDRRGFELGMVDENTITKWRKDWAAIVKEEYVKVVSNAVCTNSGIAYDEGGAAAIEAVRS